MRRIRRPSGQTMAVLLALAEEPTTWVHGYELCRATGLKAGTVYPILIRLADRGHLDAEWEADPPIGRPARHLYRLSTGGREYVDDLLRPAPSTTPSRPHPAAGRRGTFGGKNHPVWQVSDRAIRRWRSNRRSAGPAAAAAGRAEAV